MERQEKPQGTVAGYPKRLPFYDNEEGMALLRRLAEQRGVKASALLRMRVREEAERSRLPAPRGSAATRPGPRPGGARTERRPIWEEMAASMEALPEEALATLPEDGAKPHDHYLYGTPKR